MEESRHQRPDTEAGYVSLMTLPTEPVNKLLTTQQPCLPSPGKPGILPSAGRCLNSLLPLTEVIPLTAHAFHCPSSYRWNTWAFSWFVFSLSYLRFLGVLPLSAAVADLLRHVRRHHQRDLGSPPTTRSNCAAGPRV